MQMISFPTSRAWKLWAAFPTRVADCLAVIECAVEQSSARGTHTIITASVVGGSVNESPIPLLYFNQADRRSSI
jgi:flavin reductase (DIM6/NTAB) family NADH-FMN oxidoreductase RutF